MRKAALLAVAVLMLAACGNKNQEQTQDNMNQELTLTQEWDKVFPKSDKVDHKKVTFKNRFGITLAADLYTPKNAEGKLPAIAVSGPFGAVKEQSSGLYAQTLAERGFITIAFDPSYTGESGGEPRYVSSPDINTEDFSAAVDFEQRPQYCDAKNTNKDAAQLHKLFCGLFLFSNFFKIQISYSVVTCRHISSVIQVHGFYLQAKKNIRLCGRYVKNPSWTSLFRHVDFFSCRPSERFLLRIHDGVARTLV